VIFMLGKKEDSTRTATLAEVKDILNKRASEPDFGYEQQTCLDYANKFCKLKAGDAAQLMEKLMQIEGVSQEAAAKIVDIMPQKPSTLQVILAKEKTTAGEKEIGEIAALLAQYAKKIIEPPVQKKEDEKPEASGEGEEEKPEKKAKKKD